MASSGVVQSYGIILARRPTSSSSDAAVTGKIGRSRRSASTLQRDRVAAARARRTQVSGKITGGKSSSVLRPLHCKQKC